MSPQFKIKLPKFTLPKILSSSTASQKATGEKNNPFARIFRATVDLFLPLNPETSYHETTRKALSDSGGHSLSEFAKTGKKLTARKANELQKTNATQQAEKTKAENLSEIQQDLSAKVERRMAAKLDLLNQTAKAEEAAENFASLYELAKDCQVTSAKLRDLNPNLVVQSLKQKHAKIAFELNKSLAKDQQELKEIKVAEQQTKLEKLQTQNKYTELQLKILTNQVSALEKKTSEFARSVQPSGKELVAGLKGLVQQGGYRQSVLDKYQPALNAAGYTPDLINQVPQVKRYINEATKLVQSSLDEVNKALGLTPAESKVASEPEISVVSSAGHKETVKLRSKGFAAAKQKKFRDAYLGKPGEKINEKEYKKWVQEHHPEIPENEFALHYFDPHFHKRDKKTQK